jgi:predicted negative regulator of RcsB-dependent stress response
MEETTMEAPHTVATVGAEPSLGSELAMVKDLTGGNPVVTVVLAAILMVGGPAGWKFWTARQKAKTELEEKRMELEAKIKLAEIKAADNDDEPKKGKKSKKA